MITSYIALRCIAESNSTELFHSEFNPAWLYWAPDNNIAFEGKGANSNSWDPPRL